MAPAPSGLAGRHGHPDWDGSTGGAQGGGGAWPAQGSGPAAHPTGFLAGPGAGLGYPPGFGLPTPGPSSGPAVAPAGAAAAPRSLEDIELASIRQAVDQAGGNISMAAKALGISRNTIYRKLRWNTPR
jgi:hypothetical protein